MIALGVIFLILGVIGYAIHRIVPQSHPLSTFIMYIGLGVGFVLVVVGVLVYATHGSSLQVDSSGLIIVE